MTCCDLHNDTIEGGRALCCDTDDCGPCCGECPTCPTLNRGQRARANRLEQDIDSRRADGHEQDMLIGRMSTLLSGVANALKGEPDELTLHDWSDLPRLARELAGRS